MKKQISLTLEEARELYGSSTKLDELLLLAFTEKQLTQQPFPKSWSNISRITGYFLSSMSKVEPYSSNARDSTKNTFATEKEAKSTLAAAQLSQLMKAYNRGWVPDWDSVCSIPSNTKYCICRYNNIIRVTEYQTRWAFLAFETAEIRDEFLQNFYILIRDYFMLD